MECSSKRLQDTRNALRSAELERTSEKRTSVHDDDDEEDKGVVVVVVVERIASIAIAIPASAIMPQAVRTASRPGTYFSRFETSSLFCSMSTGAPKLE